MIMMESAPACRRLAPVLTNTGGEFQSAWPRGGFTVGTRCINLLPLLLPYLVLARTPQDKYKDPPHFTDEERRLTEGQSGAHMAPQGGGKKA